MNYPKYIPEVIRKHVDNYLVGDGHGFEGWLKSVEEYETKHIKNKELQKKYISIRDSDPEYIEVRLNKLRLESVEIKNSLNGLRLDVECMQRLVNAPEMKKVYLKNQLNDKELDLLFHQAWACNINFSEYRNGRCQDSCRFFQFSLKQPCFS